MTLIVGSLDEARRRRAWKKLHRHATNDWDFVFTCVVLLIVVNMIVIMYDLTYVEWRIHGIESILSSM